MSNEDGEFYQGMMCAVEVLWRCFVTHIPCPPVKYCHLVDDLGDSTESVNGYVIISIIMMIWQHGSKDTEESRLMATFRNFEHGGAAIDTFCT